MGSRRDQRHEGIGSAMEELPVKALMRMDPAKWDEANRRAAIVRSFLSSGDRSSLNVARHAAEVGISRTNFYHLLRVFEGWHRIGDEEPRPDGRAARGHADLVRRVLDEIGPGATLEEAFRHAGEVAERQGVTAPTRSAVRNVHGRVPAGGGLGARLGLVAAAALDACPLSVKVAGRDGAAANVVLTAVVDLADGRVATWTTEPGAAAARTLRRLLLLAAAEGTPVAPLATTSATSPHVRALLARVGLGPAGDRTLRGGMVLTAAVGHAAGSVGLRPRLGPKDRERSPLVDAGDLRRVLTEVLGRPPV